MKRRVRYRVHPATHDIVKFSPMTPPEKGDIVTVDGERRRVVSVVTDWQGLRWRIRRMTVEEL